jgi:SAM-dependent methyltransferase
MKPQSLTGERPQKETTPADLLALHDAGYDAVLAHLGHGRVLDVGCGEGFETVRLAGPTRVVIGVDYDRHSAHLTTASSGSAVKAACMDANNLGFLAHSFDSVVSSHLIEHFVDPSGHVREASRVLQEDGTFYVLTPNAPADFENPFHLRLFLPHELVALLRTYFATVNLYGLDAEESVKARFRTRRERAKKVLALDLFNLRHRIPHRLYVALYTRLLPIAYRLMAHKTTSATAPSGRWFVTETIDDTTLVLFAIASKPLATL